MITKIFHGSSAFFSLITLIIKVALVLWIGFDILELYQTNPMYRSISKFLFYGVTIWFILTQIGFAPRIKRG
jgi:uncharacterized membrane protein YdbT with pleckstrin-like domain